MLYDKEFLLKLDKNRNRTIYAKVIALNFQEYPIETIEGRVTQGSISLDGASAVRRSCSLSLVAQDFKYNDYYWGINTKFKLEIGVENTVDSSYPDIIWFPQGIYLITSFNTSQSASNFTISIQGKDKMSLLNGEIGGSLDATVDFGTIEEEDKDGIWTIRKIPIPEIIRNIVHVYGGEPYHNIVINDLETYGLELLEYRYDVPMYLYRPAKPESPIYTNMTLNGDTTMCLPEGDEEEKPLSALTVNNYELEPLVDHLINPELLKPIRIDNEWWYIAKIEQHDAAGYRTTDLTYAGDLIAKSGESITSVLDKIKNMLVEFEYFYDLDGRFVFQKKQSFTSTMWSPKDESGENEELQQSKMLTSTYAYTFSGGELITAFNNNPNLLNLRNDYSIWGERETMSGAKVPIHMRYAIDTKPVRYQQILVPEDDPAVIAYNNKYNTQLPFQPEPKTFLYGKEEDGKYDWREIIYQMALDNYRYGFLDDFEIRVAQANPDKKIGYPSGRTGYEQYYIDMQGFWRQLYNPELEQEIEEKTAETELMKEEIEQKTEEIYGTPNPNTNIPSGGVQDFLTQIINSDTIEKAKTCITNLYKSFGGKYKVKDNNGVDIMEPYIVINEVRSICNEVIDTITNLKSECARTETEVETLKLEQETVYNDPDHKHWNSAVFSSPDTLNFWIDFLGGYADNSDSKEVSELSQFNVKNIGSRSKVVNETTVKSIYFREVPNIIFTDEINNSEILAGYRYIQVPDLENMFKISARGKSAKDRLDELLYQHSYCVESATITAIPIYYLQPNTRIYLHDEKTGLNGDYVVSKVTIPLAYNGTMQLTATKAAENII